MIKKKCLICNKVFTVFPSGHYRKYCSMSCFRKIWVPYCKGKKVSEITKQRQSDTMKQYIKKYNPPYIFKKGQLPYNAGMVGSKSGSKNGMWKGKYEKICEYCGQEYSIYPCFLYIGSKFCSKRCFYNSKKGQKADSEAIRKRSLKQSGENHFNFKNWASREPYGKGWTRLLKQVIRERDNYKCQICGVSQRECIAKLSIHHIDEKKTNLHINNLISLCKKCHGQVHIKKIICPSISQNTKGVSI